MRADEFFSIFEHLSDGELCTLRRSPFLDRLPNDPRLYEDVAKQTFSGSQFDRAYRQRLVSILCECLYHDGRSFAALLWVVQRSLDDPDEDDGNGANALAGISCYLSSARRTPLSDEQLVRVFANYVKRPKLANNASVCREIILRRRPDLLTSLDAADRRLNVRWPAVHIRGSKKVLSCEGTFGVKPALDIGSRADEFISSRNWSTDQISCIEEFAFASDFRIDALRHEDEEPAATPRRGICFNLGLDHIGASDTDWFADVLAIVNFADDIRNETRAELSIDIWRFHGQMWQSRHMAIVDGSHHDWGFLKGMVESAT